MLGSLTSKIFAGTTVFALAALAWQAIDNGNNKAKVRRLEGEIGQMIIANEAAAARNEAAVLKAENKYLTLANKVDQNAEARVDQARSDAERYIAANRLSSRPCYRSSGPAAGGQGDGAGSSEAGSAVPQLDDLSGLVAVRDTDIQICTANTLQAIAGREWALEIEAKTSN